MEQVRATEGTLNTLNFNEIKVNNVDPDQTPHHAASDLGLHYLPMTLLRVIGLSNHSREKQKWLLKTGGPEILFLLYFSLKDPEKVGANPS